MIERLQQASQAEEHSNVDDTVGVTGEEEEEVVVELTTQAKVSFLVFLLSSAKLLVCFKIDQVLLQCVEILKRRYD